MGYPIMTAKRWIASLLLLAGMMAGAAGATLAEDSKDKQPTVIEPLYTQWCARCHNLNGLNAVCPDLSTIGARRDEAYIRLSINDPNAYIVPGYPRDVMPNFSLLLKPDEVDTLVKFLLTLKGQTIDPNKVGQKVQW